MKKLLFKWFVKLFKKLNKMTIESDQIDQITLLLKNDVCHSLNQKDRVNINSYTHKISYEAVLDSCSFLFILEIQTNKVIYNYEGIITLHSQNDVGFFSDIELFQGKLNNVKDKIRKVLFL